jgi:opacity protein-like surface antigen
MVPFQRTLRLPLWFAVLFAWSVGSEHVLAAERPTSISWVIDAESWFVGGARVRGGGSQTGSFDELGTTLRGVISPQIGQDLLLRLGAEWQRLAFGVTDQAMVPSELHKVNALIGLDYQLNDEWLLRADLKPGIYSDFEDVSWRDVDAPLLIGGLYLVNADLQWLFGVRIDLRSEYPVLPALGVRWRFADAWTLNLLMPNPRLEYDLNDRVKAYLNVGAELSTATVGDHFGDHRGRSDLNHARLDYTEIRVGSGFSWNIRPLMTVEADAGYLVYRRLNYSDQDLTIRSVPAPYVRVALQLRF